MLINQNIETFLKDLKDNIQILQKVPNFSAYHFLSMLSNEVEFLGKILCCCDSVFGKDDISKFTFSYAILKLNAFKDYQQFISIKNKISIGNFINKEDNKEEYNLNDVVELLNTKVKLDTEMNFYHDFRCSFSHSQKPTNKLGISSKTNKSIYKKNNLYVLDALKFSNDFCNAIDEILKSTDKNVSKYIKQNWLYIEDYEEPNIIGIDEKIETLTIENDSVTACCPCSNKIELNEIPKGEIVKMDDDNNTVDVVIPPDANTPEEMQTKEFKLASTFFEVKEKTNERIHS